MTERQNIVLNLIKENKSVEEIKNNLNISSKELIRILASLKNKGYNLSDEFLINGNHDIILSKNLNNVTEIKLEKENNINIMVIADTHFGSSYEDMDSVDKVYSLAKEKNIHYVLHLGDLFDGKYRLRSDVEKDVDRIIKKYPMDNSITTFFILGNHDKHILKKNEFNINNVISSSRLDLIPIGVEKGTIKLDKSNILLLHSSNSNSDEKTDSEIILRGHFHNSLYKNFKTIDNTLGLSLNVLSLCNIKFRGYDGINQKGFSIMNITFDNNKFSEAFIEQMTFNKEIEKVNEINHQFIKLK